jgi:putative transposase
MLVRKAFQFRLRPTKAQAKLLQAQLDECRWLYNELLAQRKKRCAASAGFSPNLGQ